MFKQKCAMQPKAIARLRTLEEDMAVGLEMEIEAGGWGCLLGNQTFDWRCGHWRHHLKTT